jgi:hypothetical protein
MTPKWLELFAPLPDTAVFERKPVASTELLRSGKADAIAGWESITVNLSDVAAGMRHVMVTLDGDGKLLSASDLVLIHRTEPRDRHIVTIYNQENVGGRFDEDGAFHGSRWQTRTEQIDEDDEQALTTSLPSPPSASDVTSLRALVEDVIRRAPARCDSLPR